jgi:hypothetical protein
MKVFSSQLRDHFACAIAAFIAMSAPLARAEQLSEPWTSVRALGMGNAYTAIVDDSDSLFYNPAGLARNTSFSWTLFNPRIGANGAQAIENAQVLSSISNDPVGALNQLYGSQLWLGGGAQSAVLMPNFGLSVFSTSEVGLAVSNPAATTMNLNYVFDYGGALGFGVDFLPKFVMFGMVLKWINRTGTTLPIGPSTIATLDPAVIEGELKRRGSGYGADFGMVLTLPSPIRPTLSIVYKNAGYTNFKHEEGAGAPTGMRPELIIGGALEIDTPLVSLRPVIDYKYADRYDLQFGRKLHLGVEVDIPFIDIRAGLHQGYWTAGLGMSLGILRLDAASYGVELGEYPGQLEDRRYVAQLTLELGFDPGDFGFGGTSSKSGERRRLKQRR